MQNEDKTIYEPNNDDEGMESFLHKSMEEVITAFKKTGSYKRKTSYIFLTKPFAGVQTTSNVHGYMPYLQPFGFVSGASVNVERVIAHELGHGAFGLVHTFINKGYSNDENARNLMSYNNNSYLGKHQWDIIQKNEAGEGVMDSVQDGMDKSFMKRTYYNNQVIVEVLTHSYSEDLERLAKLGESGSGEDFKYNMGQKPKTEEGEKWYQYYTSAWGLSNNMDNVPTDVIFSKYANYTKLGCIANIDLTCAQQYINRFKEKNSSADYYNTHGVANKMLEIDRFANRLSTIGYDFIQLMTEKNGDIKNVTKSYRAFYTRDNGTPKIYPFSFGMSDSKMLLSLVGGIQEVTIDVRKRIKWQYSKEYETELIVTIYDDYGVSEDDFTKSTFEAVAAREALFAFWMLQFNISYKPFRTVYTYKITVNGKL